MQNIRIIHIPEMKAVYSGPLTDGEKFEKFNNWFSAYKVRGDRKNYGKQESRR